MSNYKDQMYFAIGMLLLMLSGALISTIIIWMFA